jgi:cytochrome c oxidase subunit 2
MKTFNIIILTLSVLAIILISHWLGQQAYQWLPTSAAIEAEPIGDLFSFLVTLGSIIFLGVTGVLSYSLLFYRAAKNDVSDGPALKGNNQLEVIWTVIPLLLVTWIAIYSYHIYQRMNVLGPLPMVDHFMETPAYAQTDSAVPQPVEKIDVLAKQWAWSFHYRDRQVTSSELHLPVDHPVQLSLTSADVLHGFYVPNFRIKQDIVPNRTIEFKFTPNRIGQYQLQDSQFSGTYFATMNAPVYVESTASYEQWLTDSAQNPLVPAQNAAKTEHEQNQSSVLHSHWQTVKPNTPSPVNAIK